MCEYKFDKKNKNEWNFIYILRKSKLDIPEKYD